MASALDAREEKFVFDFTKDQVSFRLPIRIFLYSTECCLCERSPGKATNLQGIF